MSETQTRWIVAGVIALVIAFSILNAGRSDRDVESAIDDYLEECEVMGEKPDSSVIRSIIEEKRESQDSRAQDFSHVY